MESFYDQLVRWQPFFCTIAGVAATLAGLLFVSLSINRDKITACGNEVLLRLARRAFGDLLYALFIAIVFLAPNHHSYGVAIPLFCLSLYRGYFVIIALLCKAAGPRHKSARFEAFWEHAFSALACAAFLIAAVVIYRDQVLAIFYVVPIVALLLANATLNAWKLLIVENNPVTALK